MDRGCLSIALGVVFGGAAVGCLSGNPAWDGTGGSTGGGTADAMSITDTTASTTAGASTTASATSGTSTASSDASATTGSADATVGDSSSTGASGSGYVDAVVSDGPVAYWRFEETVPPTAFDEGPDGLDGTYMGDIVLATPGALCGEPESLGKYFGGTNSRVEVADVLGFEGVVPYTLEMWVKLEPIDGGTAASSGALISKSDDSSGDALGWYMTVHNQAPDASAIRLQRPPAGSANADAPLPGIWFHLVGSYDGASTQRVYINGELAAARDGAEPIAPNTEPLRIGDGDGWGEINASIDEVAIYDYVLPEARIVAHYEAGAGC